MQTEAEKLLNRMVFLYENIYTLLGAFQTANQATTNEPITIELKNEDGTTKEVVINSFQQIQQELTRIDNNFNSLTSPTSYIVNGDGSISEYNKVSFFNADYISNFTFDGDACMVDRQTTIQDLIFPTVKLPIELEFNNIKSDIFCKIYEITSGFENIPENIKELNLQYMLQNGEVTYLEYEQTLKTEKQKINTFGKFNVEDVSTSTNTNEFILTLDTLKYTSTSVLNNSISLIVGDILVSKTGITKYEIIDINTINNRIFIKRIAGVETPVVGVSELFFNTIIENTNISVVNLPIKPEKKLVVFLSSENINAISYPSVGIKIDTAEFKVVNNNITYSLDEYFQKYVTNITEWLNTLIIENTIPYSLGIKPDKPVLNVSNFKVLQINKHIVDAKSKTEIDELNKQKQSIQNDIDYKQKLINTTQKELDSVKYSSVEEKNIKLESIITLRNEINTLKENQLTIIRDIDSNAIKYGLKTITPKYKVIGFWDLQENLYSPLTSTQHIIKYEVQYRYLSKDVDTSEATTYKMISNGNEITVVFSNWNELATHTLNKTIDINGNLSWEQPVLDSVDDININQCSVSINEGESVEIKVRAVTEAGYPISPVKSDWSESIRIDFPNDLVDNSIQNTVSENTIDLSKAEFNNILNNLGLLNHISGTIQEAEKTFYHNANDISSGQYTPEQKNIPLDECIKTILNEINNLKSIDNQNNISVSFVDFEGEIYNIQNNSTLEINGGNYSDTFNLQDQTQWGGIIRKRGYVKIRNNNSIPLEIKTLVPGTELNQLNAPYYYNVPTIIEDNIYQHPKEIIYFRNIDLVGGGSIINDAFKLVMPKGIVDPLIPNETFIDRGAEQKDKNIIVREIDGTINIIKLIDGNTTSDFLAYTTEHPDFDISNLNNMESEMVRLLNFNSNLKADQYQTSIVNNLGFENPNFVGFQDNDVYAVGKYSCGAWLYPYIGKLSTIQVVGNTSISTLIISANSEILIPIIYEYRMTDRLGNINGEVGYNINNGLIYSKKIGIDIMLNNSIFKFDIKINSNYKTKLSTIDSRNVSSIVANFQNENKETLI